MEFERETTRRTLRAVVSFEFAPRKLPLPTVCNASRSSSFYRRYFAFSFPFRRRAPEYPLPRIIEKPRYAAIANEKKSSRLEMENGSFSARTVSESKCAGTFRVASRRFVLSRFSKPNDGGNWSSSTNRRNGIARFALVPSYRVYELPTREVYGDGREQFL